MSADFNQRQEAFARLAKELPHHACTICKLQTPASIEGDGRCGLCYAQNNINLLPVQLPLPFVSSASRDIAYQYVNEEIAKQVIQHTVASKLEQNKQTKFTTAAWGHIAELARTTSEQSLLVVIALLKKAETSVKNNGEAFINEESLRTLMSLAERADVLADKAILHSEENKKNV